MKAWFQQLGKIFMVGMVCGQLLTTGCVRTATIKQPAYAELFKHRPLSKESIQTIKKQSPKDAVFADLLQAFALMRFSSIEQEATQKNILNLLMSSVSSFEDMRDPINFSKAFSADEDKAFRGLPHERMFASAMAGVFLMAHNNYAQALPYLRNAEFLDARFQKLPFGTDAPLIYALMYRSLLEQNAAHSDIDRARDGVFRSVRFLTMQEPLIEALVHMAKADLRPMAIANRLAYMIYEISIYHSLLSAPNDADINALIHDAGRNASIFISTVNAHFKDEYKERMKPLIKELSNVYKLKDQEGLKHLEQFSMQKISSQADAIARKLKAVMKDHARFKQKIIYAQAMATDLTQKILQSASADKMVITFSGVGPALVREGDYQEISVIKPSDDGDTRPIMRKKNITAPTACGFHRVDKEDFCVVLCKKNITKAGDIKTMPSGELLSLSRKATTVQGREFEKVLKGRAQFRAATEKVSDISKWSAFFLFYLGAEVMHDCQVRGNDQSCYAKGVALWTVAGITAVFSGTVWLAGRASNPAADSRFIHLMYESAWVAL